MIIEKLRTNFHDSFEIMLGENDIVGLHHTNYTRQVVKEKKKTISL